ncbi:flagellin [Anaerobacterium chartisolvens]|uniref:Flagellin n=1 Tax=Anaerobacterium chartisolvens TaxID=1297424 RepID=A0A369BKB5_9FIRM|nr:flagellin [Anaerobacterium chartisolvens]RCX21048.1 flagellin [Anaerobacterium chartisolvens]
MIINHNLAAMNSHRQLTINSGLQSKALEKLSSGYRINRAADDAAGLSISEKMRAEIRGLNQCARNAQDGISMIQTAEGALNETHSILQRMRELSVQAANGTNGMDDTSYLQREIDQLNEQIDTIAKGTKFNGHELISAERMIEIIIGRGGSISPPYIGLEVGFKSASATSLGVGTVDVSVNPVNALDRIDSALSQVSSQRSSLGAYQNRLEHTISNLLNTSENLQAAESRIRDVDMAKEMMNYTKNNILIQSATAMLAQANQQPQSVLQLLR